jgi:fatty acid desaturase
VIQQHMGLRSSVPDWRVTCHTVEFGPLMAYLYWQMNFHIEHHTYAAVPFFNLPKLHKTMAFNMPIPVRGFWRGVARILSIQRKQRRDPGYCFMPEFPATAAPPKLAG